MMVVDGDVDEVRICRCGSCVSEHGRPVNWIRVGDVWTSEFGEVVSR